MTCFRLLYRCAVSCRAFTVSDSGGGRLLAHSPARKFPHSAILREFHVLEGSARGDRRASFRGDICRWQRPTPGYAVPMPSRALDILSPEWSAVGHQPDLFDVDGISFCPLQESPVGSASPAPAALCEDGLIKRFVDAELAEKRSSPPGPTTVYCLRHTQKRRDVRGFSQLQNQEKST